MGIIFYGWRSVATGTEEILVNCPSCEGATTTDILVYSKYFHIFWIPIFPFEKTAMTICSDCGLKKQGISLDSKSILNSKEIKSNFRHPYWTYIGITIFSLMILSGIIRLFV
jgi:hypothetical protein